MSSICSLLWIGPARSLAEEGASHASSLDITWVRDANEALALSRTTALTFDAALLDCEPDGVLPAVRMLGQRKPFPPLLVKLRRPARDCEPQLLAAGAAGVVLTDEDEVGRRCSDGQELVRRIRSVAAGSRASARPHPHPEPGERQRELAFGARRVDPLRARAQETTHAEVASTGARSRRVQLPKPPDSSSFKGMVAFSPSMQPVLALAERARHSLATVLLTGETGTGKEVVAKAIHEGGPRKDGAFVAVNCAAFPETLLESELFGHKKGAFTSAHRDKRGLFEAANGGTLFLDEIGETSPALQAKLLRVLQEREVRPVGASTPRSVNVRVISATNRSLHSGKAADSFRRDLYYRLAVFPIAIPPLRKRVEDILPLAEHFLALHGRREEKLNCRLSTGAERLLLAHSWPGNVRELENEMQRALALVEAGESVDSQSLSPNLAGALAPMEANVVSNDSLRDNMRRVEAWIIRRTLEQEGNRRAATARKLGITREGLYKKMKRLNVE